MFMKKILSIYIVLIAVAVFFVPHLARAADAAVDPVLTDIKAVPREMVNQSLVLTNTSGGPADFYVFVNNIMADTGEQVFKDQSEANLSVSPANWIDISRAVIHLAPGENKKINYQVNVNLAAKPGIHHALIAFAAGANRGDASTHLDQAATLTVNIQVPDNIKEGAQILQYTPGKSVFFGLPVGFSFALENNGNRDIIPEGEIIIYGRSGQEVGSVKINTSAVSVSPNATARFTADWNGGQALGKYKAVLNLRYGGTQQTLQDISYFWVLPFPALVFGGLIIFCLFGLVYVLSKARHKKRLALWEQQMTNIQTQAQPVIIKIPSINITPRDNDPENPSRYKKVV
jgi:hypothetical protein